ncbi:unnamed protein product [Kuraishia capsulata CBS 1993]|uniref:CID domain-containing protein n=1 Tax=Kuraishia capsulata CBS 1993 TaxID=1382522 RepID=W6MW38_9ASCO|nr:uncharacterized protein KUCA_T00002834001 [Kuraishia capsulata CBS 1993]CDK26860.1 unnamed protein product [Kuraishia capsulata CBS 1993]
MSSDLEVFDSTLKEFIGLRPPGVSGSRIKKLTKIAIDNVEVCTLGFRGVSNPSPTNPRLQSESQIVQKLYIHCKGIQPSHKLGALYVVDSIVRSYVDQARSSGQTIDELAKDGTFARGAFNIQSLIENLIDDALAASDDHADKILKLVSIWETHKTFSDAVIKSIKAKHFTSTTPPGSPPKKAVANTTADPRVEANSASSASTADKDPSSILQALASLANKAPAVNGLNQAPNRVLSPGLPQPPAQVAPPPPANDPNAIFQMLQNLKGNANPLPPQQQMYQNQGQQPNLSYRDRDDRQGNRRGRERSRSPRRDNRHPLPPSGSVEGEKNIPGTPHYRQKFVTTDNSIPAGSIKVLSRTIFIGGVPQYMSEQDLMTELRPYAEVQSVILNSDRKHAFVKVYSRAEAESVISSFTQQNNPSSLRARWGVGFGPRDCCDYQLGVSTIPLSRLTDADKRWAVAAEWGGTGGQPLVPGLVVEEPDIEIGQGVSSKAISKKMPTNSARNGPRSNRPGEFESANHNLPQNPMVNANTNNPLAQLFNQQQPQMAQPQQFPQMNFGAPGAPIQPAQMNQFAQMMAAMQQMQQPQGQAPPQGQGQPTPDMANMLQNIASMMRQQQNGM